MRFAALLLSTLALATLVAPAARAEKAKPIKALLITGGCCHDYEKQKQIITEGVSERANVEWTIVHEGGSSTDHKLSIHENPDWAKGYDIVVHNECFANQKEVGFIHNVTEAHKSGVPAVMIHCAMHCYRGETEEWFKMCGVTSRNHGRKAPIKVEVVERQHPIFKNLTGGWQTPQGELYNVAKMWDTAKPLAMGVEANRSHACIWTNQYGKGRIFCTTLGHHNETMSQPVYLDMLARGVLWACDKLDENGKPQPGYEGTGPKPKVKGPEPTPAEQ